MSKISLPPTPPLSLHAVGAQCQQQAAINFERALDIQVQNQDLYAALADASLEAAQQTLRSLSLGTRRAINER